MYKKAFIEMHWQRNSKSHIQTLIKNGRKKTLLVIKQLDSVTEQTCSDEMLVTLEFVVAQFDSVTVPDINTDKHVETSRNVVV